MKRIWNRKALSLFLAVVMIVGSINAGLLTQGTDKVNASGTSQNTEYQEVSFHSFGVEDDIYTTQQDKVHTSLTNFDKVAFTGKFTFAQLGGSSPSTDNVIVLGGTASNKWAGIRIFLHSNGNLYVNSYLTNVTVVGNNPICSLTVSELEGINSLVNQEIQIRMTFDYDATTTDAVRVQVSFEVKGQTITKDAKTLTGGEAALTRTDGAGMLIKPNGSIDVKSVITEEIPYTELAFENFGLDDGSQTGAEKTENYKEHTITSWNKVAVSGYVTFNTTNASSYIGFGAGNGYVAIRFSPADEKIMLGGAAMSSAEGNLLSDASVTAGEKVYIRITFDVKGTKLTANLYVKEADPITATYNISADSVSGMRVYTKYAEDTIAYGSVREEEVPYEELTFENFGLEDGFQTGAEKTENYKEHTITSWNKVAVSGYVTFNTTNASSYIGFGAGNGYVAIRFSPADEKIMLGGAAMSSAEGNLLSDASVTAGEKVYIRITFDVKGTKLTTNLYVKEADPITATYNISADSVSGMRIYTKNAGDMIAYGSVRDEEESYTELTFKSFGLQDGFQTGAEKTQSYKRHTITSWNQVAVSGYVAFDTTSASSYVGFGAGDGYVAIRFNPTDEKVILGGAGMSPIEGNQYSYVSVSAGEKIYIRVIFKVEEDILKVKLYIKEAAPLTATYTISADSVSGMRVYTKDAKDTISYQSTDIDIPDLPIIPDTPGVSKTPRKALSKYNVITFSDMGIGDQTVQGRTANCNGSVKDLNGKVFKGMVTFPTKAEDQMDGILTIGGNESNRWLGLRIGVTSEGAMYIRDAANGANRWEILPSTMKVGDDVRGQEIELALTFTCVDKKNVYVGVYVNGTFCGERLFKNLTNEFGSTLMVYSAGASIKVASIVTGFSDTPQKELSEFKMLTFSDFGIKNQTVKGCTINCNNSIQDLNGKLFQGKVKFTAESTGNDGILTIGGNTTNRWLGIRVGVTTNGQLYICEGANPAQRWNISSKAVGISDVRAKEIELGMTFICSDKNNVYVGVYVNGRFCGEKLFKNLVHPLGGTLMVYSDKNPVRIASSETPWTKFLKSDVNFAYFGFTDNWKQELTAICR